MDGSVTLRDPGAVTTLVEYSCKRCGARTSTSAGSTAEDKVAALRHFFFTEHGACAAGFAVEEQRSSTVDVGPSAVG